MADPYDPAREGAQMAFDGRMSYADYLRLDKVSVRAGSDFGRA